ncbi:hypothetical protein VSDG_05016 [Cytospora chrysosperma]|uniref:Uncharacterized protein n=1 Tax=Cytospora chrysosperma TaxID=252740 RepID=A0A423VYE0_CYTCH|nr:hypothetical protein VSDG_05016 [Valsa sordida]
MASDDHSSRCLSADPHTKPSDPMLHYLGCLEFCEREAYFSSVTEPEKQAIKIELRRISYLRELVGKDEDELQLARNLEKSMEKWRHSELYKGEHGIDAVRAWRTKRTDRFHRPLRNNIDQPQVDPQPGVSKDSSEEYVPDYDINAHLIMFENSKPVEGLIDTRLRGDFPNHKIAMPYLHWETDRQRQIISRFIDKETEKHRREKEERDSKQKKKRQNIRGALFIPEHKLKGDSINWARATRRIANQAPPNIGQTAVASLAAKISLYSRLGRHFKSPIFKKDQNGRVLTKSEVGQVLFDAAMLYEAMSSYRDKKFIQAYLHEDPPLHPRRTLDQAHYWALKTTRNRDRDQVVYRGTKPTLEHSISPKTGKWNCFEMDDLAADESRQEAQDPGGDKTERQESHCIHCRSHIQKVSRLLMVDQLWMWILDEKTIITAFPRRYGMNKQDLSGVHKSIRTRLQNLHQGHIKTVFDLALIILDECSNTFFKNRTRTADRQPQVLDIFSQAIGKINNKQTISFQHLWDWTEKLSHLSLRGGINTDMSEFVAPLLNISTEGELQREIKDVIDELDIMINIYTQQRDVMKKFVRDVKNLLQPNKTKKWGKKQRSAERAASETLAPGPSHPDEERKEPKETAAYIHERFGRLAQELLDDIEDRTAELKGLQRSAEGASNSLEALVGLKQQQASVVQAWQSVQQADEAIKQGRSIMVFTVVTIVFLPLAFMASIFGMNNLEISGSGPMTMRAQFKLMFGISTGIIFVVLVFAYSSFVRNLCWLAYRYLVTLLLVKTPAYDRIYLSLDWRSASMTRKVDKEIRDMKLLVKKEKQRRTNRPKVSGSSSPRRPKFAIAA